MAYQNSPRIVTDGLVLCLDAGNTKSYPGTGAAWTDLSRNGNNGTLTNGPTFDSANGGSIVFDGTNDYANIPSQPITANSSLSIETFINIPSFSEGSYRGYIDSGNLGTGTQGYCLAKENSSPNQLYFAINSGYIAITGLTSNTWYHVTATAQSGTPYTLKMFINGTQKPPAQSATTNTLSIPVSYIRLFQNYTGGFITPGSMAFCKIYNRALTPSEILQNYNATKSRFGL